MVYLMPLVVVCRLVETLLTLGQTLGLNNVSPMTNEAVTIHHHYRSENGVIKAHIGAHIPITMLPLDSLKTCFLFSVDAQHRTVEITKS